MDSSLVLYFKFKRKYPRVIAEGRPEIFLGINQKSKLDGSPITHSIILLPPVGKRVIW